MNETTFTYATWAIQIGVLVMSAVTHEYFHGWTADRFGDPTARQAGRLTLNPLAHIDPFMTILMPVLMVLTFGFAFGGAKPVPVNPFRLTRKQDMLVSLAGPGSNLVLAVLSFLLLLVLHPFLPWKSLGFFLLFYGIILNLLLAVFNMVPVPPLDGSHVLSYCIPQLEEPFRRVGFAGIMIVILLLYSGVIWFFLDPILNVAYFGVEMIYARGS